MDTQHVLGGTFVVGGFVGLGVVLRHPPAVSLHVYIFAGLAVFGALIIDPTVVGGALAQLKGFLPWVKP